MATTFRALFDNSPGGTIRDGETTTTATATATASQTHALGPELIPNSIRINPQLSGGFVGWAQEYLNSLQHSPNDFVLNSVQSVRANFDNILTGNEGSIVALYALTVQMWTALFVKTADHLQTGDLDFVQCQPTNGICADWRWTRQGTTRMVIEHKGGRVFNHFCDDIIQLASANGGFGSSLGVDGTGNATGATAILLKVSHIKFCPLIIIVFFRDRTTY